MVDCSGIPGLNSGNFHVSNETFYRNGYNFSVRTLRANLTDVILSPHTTYSLTITGLMDKAGNVMPPATFSFTTETPSDPSPLSFTPEIPLAGNDQTHTSGSWVEIWAH